MRSEIEKPFKYLPVKDIDKTIEQTRFLLQRDPEMDRSILREDEITVLKELQKIDELADRYIKRYNKKKRKLIKQFKEIRDEIVGRGD